MQTVHSTDGPMLCKASHSWPSSATIAHLGTPNPHSASKKRSGQPCLSRRMVLHLAMVHDCGEGASYGPGGCSMLPASFSSAVCARDDHPRARAGRERRQRRERRGWRIHTRVATHGDGGNARPAELPDGELSGASLHSLKSSWKWMAPPCTTY